MTARSALAAVVAALVVLSIAVTGIGAVSAQDGAAGNDTTGANDTGTDLPPADDIYVRDNGDAVLAYENETSEGRANYGLNVTEGLFHALVVSDIDGANDTTANATAILTGDNFTGNGTLAMPRPDSLSNLSVDVNGTRTSENARSDATLSATVTDPNATRTLPVETARTAGNVTVGASNFSAAAEAHAQLSTPLGQPQHQSFRITEQDGTYTLDAAQNYTVPSFVAERWSTRRAARQALEQQYVSVAESFGGTADLSLESYSFTQQRGGSRLDVEYTVTYRGIERVLTNQLATRLSSSQAVDLNQSETDAIGQRLRNLTVNEAAVSFDQRGRSIDATMRADLGNYDDAVLAALDAGESVNMSELNANANASAGVQSNISASLAQFRKQFEARQAANLTNRYSFAANLSKDSNRALSVSAEFHSRTDNWAQYVQELNDRGIQTSDLHYELHAATEGERVNVTAAVEVSGENLLRGVSNQALNSTASGEGGDARKYVKAFRDAGFRKARTDVSLRDGRVRVESGAAFRNMTVLRDTFVSAEHGNLQSVVGRTENGTVTSYVRMQGAVPANATEEDVRNLPYVTDDTTVHMPDSWNRSFPTTNTTRANDYLGLTGSAAGVTGLFGPGFGIVVAVVALLAAALVAVRRRG